MSHYTQKSRARTSYGLRRVDHLPIMHNESTAENYDNNSYAFAQYSKKDHHNEIDRSLVTEIDQLSTFNSGGEPRSKKVDNLEEILTNLPKTGVKVGNPTYKVSVIGRRVLNYCGEFGKIDP